MSDPQSRFADACLFLRAFLLALVTLVVVEIIIETIADLARGKAPLASERNDPFMVKLGVACIAVFFAFWRVHRADKSKPRPWI